MILDKKPLTLSQVKEYAKESEEKKPLHAYLKKFVKLPKDKAAALADEIRALGNPKIKEENIVKIADFLPENQEEINKILTDVSLTEEESNAVFKIVKKY